ncbi:MAG TPA: cupin domain-containing protein [Chloroflexota bacterium]
MTTSESLQRKSFDNPEETRSLGRGTAQVVNVGGIGLMHVTLQPGWRWSEDLKPRGHTETCQANHVIQMVSGHLRVTHEGSEEEFGPGELGHIPPGHDGWVVGNESAVYLDITGSGIWPKPS